MVVALVELTPYDPVAGAPVTLRLTSHDDVRACLLNNEVWWPALLKKGSYGIDLFDPTFTGRATATLGALEFDLSCFPDAARYQWGDKPAKVWFGELGDAYGAYVNRFDGLTVAATSEGGRLVLPLRVNDTWFASSLLTTYAGTGGLEGGADLKGQVKPLAIGQPKFVEPVCIDRVNSVFQFHAYGSTQGVLAALENLVRFPASVGDYATYAALVAAAIPSGRFATCLAQGLVRFGAPPTGLITLLVQGDNGGPDGWVRTPGKVIKRLAKLAGATDAQIDAASLAALDVAVPRNLSFYSTQQVIVGDLIRRVAAQCNAVAGISWLSKLFVCRATIGAPALTLKTDGSALPQAGEPQLLEAGAPYYRLQMAADVCWRPHDVNEIAFTAPIVDMGDYVAGTVYREGNIVRSTANGVRYLYTNPTPTAGNNPPNGAYWSVYETAPSASTLVGSVDYGSQVGGTKPPADATKNIVTRAAAAPGSPTSGDIWIDTSVTPNVLKTWNGAAWVASANLVLQGTHIGVENGATVGAPAGTQVNGVDAALVQGAAAAGKALDDAVGDNNKLSKAEKRAIVPWVDQLVNDVPTLVAQANAVGLTTEANALSAAWNGGSGFLTYLQSLGGVAPNYVYRDYSTNTAQVGATYEARIKALNGALKALQAKGLTTALWGSIPASGGRPVDNATADVRLVNVANMAFVGNSAYKTSGGAAWNGSAYTPQVYGPQFFSCRVQSAGLLNQMCGLATAITALDYGDIYCGFYVSAGGGTLNLRSFANYYVNLSHVDHGTVTANDVLTVTYDDVNVRWYKNGTLLRTAAAPSNQAFYGRVNGFEINSGFSDIRHGWLSSIEWSKIGGAGKAADNATVGAIIGTNLLFGSTMGLASEARLDNDNLSLSRPANGNVRINRPGAAVSTLSLTGDSVLDNALQEWAQVNNGNGAKPADYASNHNVFSTISSGGGAVTAQGNKFTKSAGGGDWNISVYGTKPLVRGIRVSAVIDTPGTYVMVGLSGGPNTSNYTDSYNIFAVNDGSIQIYLGSTGLGAVLGPGNWTSGSELSVVYDNQYLRFFVNGVQAYYYDLGPNYTFYGKVCMYSPGMSVSQFKIEPWYNIRYDYMYNTLLGGDGRVTSNRILKSNLNAGLRAVAGGFPLSDTWNGSNVTVNVASTVYYNDVGGSTTYSAAGYSGYPFGETRYWTKPDYDYYDGAESATGYNAPLSLNAALNNTDTYIGAWTTRASSGVSGGGGTGGGTNCVDANAWVLMADGTEKRAKHVRAGDLIMVLTEDLQGLEPCEVEGSHVSKNECVVIEMEDTRLALALNTPLTTRIPCPIYIEHPDGTRELLMSHPIAANAHRYHLPVAGHNGNVEWVKPTRRYAGKRAVAHIRCHHRTYGASMRKGAPKIFTHNPAQKP